MDNLYLRYRSQRKGKFGLEIEEIEIINNYIYFVNFSIYNGLEPIFLSYKIGNILLLFIFKLLFEYNIINEKIHINDKIDFSEYQEFEVFFEKTHISFRIPRILPYYKILGFRDPIKTQKIFKFLTKLKSIIMYITRTLYTDGLI
ncbi:protein mago nashi (nucleomorph) [Lotharella oceanica]|uniref:Protein mago nashi n=1 Tax=Lotharella oceanica TaxID=641309 RepID=A0A060DG95_9EUKA|nr:protein mago nashi [Lotharella oceanica]|mmetsp:Transcript_2837/g.5389  ORF Transcript_2837/g.5389 Transcript_2837/m.5389 type:complete len:145 (+) Transcript_2837:813-1247(+)